MGRFLQAFLNTNSSGSQKQAGASEWSAISLGAMNEAVPAPPSFRQALRFWGWLGCVSFGGPAGQIAIT